MSISNLQFCEMAARLNRNRVREIADAHPTEGSEAELQADIVSALKRLGWPYLQTRMDSANTYTIKGAPDFVIFAPHGKTWCVECKTAKGKLSTEQEGFGMWLNTVNHHYAVVRSLQAFTELVGNC